MAVDNRILINGIRQTGIQTDQGAIQILSWFCAEQMLFYKIRVGDTVPVHEHPVFGPTGKQRLVQNPGFPETVIFLPLVVYG